MTVLVFKWSVSRSKNTYGYNICSLWVDGKKMSSCNGGGYDMKGTALGDWTASAFRDELLRLKKPYYGLSFHNPNYDPGKAVVDGETVEEREKTGGSLGLDRYQAFHSASSKVPTDKHIVPLIDGACGFSEVERILKDIGYTLEYITESRNETVYVLRDAPHEMMP